MSNEVNQQDIKANARKYFVYAMLTWSFVASVTAVGAASRSPPEISTSVDDYKTVCPSEQIYLTCRASDSWSLSWTSLVYVGQTAAIEFNQEFDRPGVGKLVSLPRGRATLAQLMTTERSISSDLQVTIPSDISETQVTCTNNRGAASTKTFMLSRESPASPTFLGCGEIIAENSASGIKAYNFTWLFPENSEIVDIKYMIFQINHEPPIFLMNNSTGIILPLSYGQHNMSIVAVDRCNRQSEADVCQLQIQKGVTHNGLNRLSSEETLGGYSSARNIKFMLNVLVTVVLVSLFVIFLSM